MDLVKNVLLFSQALRKRKVGVTVDNVKEALRGISFIDMQKKEDFYHLLRSNFISHREEIKSFDELFEQFWSMENNIAPSIRKKDETNILEEEEEETPSFGSSKESQIFLKDWTDEGGENSLKGQEDMPQYSPEEVLRRKDFGLLELAELEKVKEFVLSLSRKIAMSLSRRWKVQKKGEQIDFRRSIRQSIKYGGEIIELRMRRQKAKPLRLDRKSVV